jgi:hypothetical protein
VTLGLRPSFRASADMSLPPESIEEGKCYLADARIYPQVRQVLQVHPDGRIQYRSRPLPPARDRWAIGVTDRKAFAAAVSREVPCDWTPETDE